MHSKVSGVDSKMLSVDSQLPGVDSKMFGMDSQFSGVESKTLGVDSQLSGVNSKILGVDLPEWAWGGGTTRTCAVSVLILLVGFYLTFISVYVLILL
jgi:hypothetical protein